MFENPHGYSIRLWDGRESNRDPFVRMTGFIEVEFEASGVSGYAIRGPKLSRISVSTQEHYDENTPKKFLEALKSIGVLEGETTYLEKETHVCGQRNYPTVVVRKTEQRTKPVSFDLTNRIKAESHTQKPVPVEIHNYTDPEGSAKHLIEGGVIEREYRQWCDFNEMFSLQLDSEGLQALLESKYPGNDILIDENTIHVENKLLKLPGVPQTSERYRSLERFEGTFKREIKSKTNTGIASGCDKESGYNWHYLDYTTDVPLLDFVSKELGWEHEGTPVNFSEIVKQLTEIEKSRKI